MPTFYTREHTDILLEGKSDDNHNHSASDTTSGVFPPARLGTGTSSAGSYVDGGTGAWTPLPDNIDDSAPSASTTYSGNRIDTLLNDKTDVGHSHGVADITSGIFPPEQIGIGTPTAGQYVDGGTGAWTDLPAGGGGGVTMVDNGDGTVTLT